LGVTELARFGFPRQVTNDEKHVEHEAAHPKGEAKASYLLFAKAKHGRD
jgi:hypothetical protein